LLTIEETKHGAIIGVTASRAPTGVGYTIEVKLPWSTLGQSSVAFGALLGLDVHINDDDDGGSRDGKKAWFNTADTSWQNPSTFATVRLIGVH
jgi:oligosaccharide reducing-end xylanase